MQNVHGFQETNEPEKLCCETQKDNRDRSRGNKELQKSQPSHPEERGEEQLEKLGTIREGEQKLNAATTIEEETVIQQQMNQIHKVKEESESMYYQVTNRN